MSYIFISYKHDIAVDLLDSLHNKLKESSYDIWFDGMIVGGEKWTKSIDTAIRDSLAMILVATKEALGSDQVNYEWSYAMGRDKTIITLLVDQMDLPPRLSEYQYIDFTGNKRPWTKLLSALDKIQFNQNQKHSNKRNSLENNFGALQQIQKEQKPHADVEHFMREGDTEANNADITSALKSYNRAYEIASDALKVQIGYKMMQIYIRQIEKLSSKDQKQTIIDKTQTILEEMLKIRPDYHAVRAYLGYVYRLKRDIVIGEAEREECLSKAENLLREALSEQNDLVDQNHNSWWNTYGSILRRLGDIRAKKSNSDDANTYYDQAILAFENAARVDKTSSNPYTNIALLYMLKKDPENMTKNYKRVEYYPPNDAGDFWGYGDQLVASLVINQTDTHRIESLFNQYDAFAPDFARSFLIETLYKIANTINAAQVHPIWKYIKLLESTISKK